MDRHEYARRILVRWLEAGLGQLLFGRDGAVASVEFYVDGYPDALVEGIEVVLK